MQTQTLENKGEQIAPYNDVAELIDREIHREMLERINFLAREYEIGNPSEVAKFLRENMFLFELLEEIPVQIRKVFGEKTKLGLRLLVEPDSPVSRELFVQIFTNREVKESLALLEKFDADWWDENAARSRFNLEFSLKYV